MNPFPQQVLKSVVENAIEDGVHRAKRAVKSVGRSAEQLGDLKDEAAHRVKRQPLRAVAAAFGIGLTLGVAAVWVALRPHRHA